MIRIDYSGRTNGEFERYDSEGTCMKCGNENTSSFLINKRRSLFDPDQLWDENMMERTCRRCFFYWFEWPMDHEETED